MYVQNRSLLYRRNKSTDPHIEIKKNLSEIAKKDKKMIFFYTEAFIQLCITMNQKYRDTPFVNLKVNVAEICLL